MNVKPCISVIMPARNEGGRVAKAIRSFVGGRSRVFPLEFVVVDDASADGCCDGLETLFCDPAEKVTIRVIRLEKWSGIPFARNTGAYAAKAPILAITDANVVACAGWDAPIFREIRPGRALCGTIADEASRWKGHGCSLDVPSMGTRWITMGGCHGSPVPVMPEAATVIAAELFRSLGGYDTAMPVYGACEPEFSVRLWLSGAEIVSVPEIAYSHRFRPEAERTPFMQQIGPLLVQNYLRFGLLYLDTPDAVRLIQHYASKVAPDVFNKALNAVASSDVWERRKHLKERLKYDFSWYCRRFGIG